MSRCRRAGEVGWKDTRPRCTERREEPRSSFSHFRKRKDRVGSELVVVQLVLGKTPRRQLKHGLTTRRLRSNSFGRGRVGAPTANVLP